MKDSEKVNAILAVPGPMLADALSEFLICKMIPSFGSDEKAIAKKKQYWEPMIKTFSELTMEHPVIAFQYETREQRDALTKEMKEEGYTFLALSPFQFDYLTNYLYENHPDDVELSQWIKPG